MIDFLLHSDRKLLEIVAAYGTWVYGVLFAIVFAETGFVVTPFLPGDSLLFATGALCATGALETPVAVGLLILAAFTGNAVNYAAGRAVGPRVFNATDRSRLSHRSSTRSTFGGRTPSSSSTAARPSSSAASCPSCAPLYPLSRGPRR